MQHTIHSILSHDQAELVLALQLEPGTARIEVQCLLQKALNVSRSYLIAHPEYVLGAEENNTYSISFQRRLKGEPIAYILGEREFFGLNFLVTPDTLIPRPETELLVELVLERLEGKLRVLDMGTGSGAISLSIAHQRPDADVWACDFSSAALVVAQENSHRLGIHNVQFVESDWFSALSGQRFDIIVSNPPYVAKDDPHLSQGDVRFEPVTALTSGSDGLDDIRHIVLQAGTHLNSGGWLLLEHGYDQAAQVRELLQQSGYANIFSAKDLSGIERCSGAQFQPGFSIRTVIPAQAGIQQ
jgi:release factor glutamine methyltransferase